MKIGGTGEFWMVVGPIIAIVLILGFTSGSPTDMVRIAEATANDVWNTVVTMFRR